MMRSIDDALADVRAKERELADQPLPPLTPALWRSIGDRCVLEAILPGALPGRYTDSIALAAYCYEQARRMA